MPACLDTPALLLCLSSALFARLHASQNASKLPSGDAPQSSATRRGIVVDYPTKTKSLVPSGPASSGENTQFPIAPRHGLIRFRAGFLTAPRNTGTGIPPSPHPGSGCQPPSYAPVVPAMLWERRTTPDRPGRKHRTHCIFRQAQTPAHHFAGTRQPFVPLLAKRWSL